MNYLTITAPVGGFDADIIDKCDQPPNEPIISNIFPNPTADDGVGSHLSKLT